MIVALSKESFTKDLSFWGIVFIRCADILLISVDQNASFPKVCTKAVGGPAAVMIADGSSHGVLHQLFMNSITEVQSKV